MTAGTRSPHGATIRWLQSGGAGRALASRTLLLVCSVASLAAQTTAEETGNFVVGETVIWVKATDAGVVQLFMSQGYRDAFARPIPLPAASLRRWADSAAALRTHPDAQGGASDSTEIRSGSLGESGTVLERWVAANNAGVRVERAGRVILHMPDDPGRDFIAAMAEAARLTQKASAPKPPMRQASRTIHRTPAASAVAKRAPAKTAPAERVSARKAPPARLAVAKAAPAAKPKVAPARKPAPATTVLAKAAPAKPAAVPMARLHSAAVKVQPAAEARRVVTPSLTHPVVIVAAITTKGGAHDAPPIHVRAPAPRKARLIPAPLARVPDNVRPHVVAATSRLAEAAKAPRVRLKTPRAKRMVLIPAPRVAAPAPAPKPLTSTPSRPRPNTRTATTVAHAPAPVSSPHSVPAPAAPPPTASDKHIRTPLGPFVIPASEMRSRATQVQYCYSKLGLRYDPDLSGSMVVRVSMAATADTTENVEITGRTWSTDGVTAGEVEACVRTLIRDWRFDTSEITQSGRTVELHLTFRPDKGVRMEQK